MAHELCVGDSLAWRQHNRRGESCANGMQPSYKRGARGRETHTVILLLSVYCRYQCYGDVNDGISPIIAVIDHRLHKNRPYVLLSITFMTSDCWNNITFA